jgi:hypothetical protein
MEEGNVMTAKNDPAKNPAPDTPRARAPARRSRRKVIAVGAATVVVGAGVIALVTTQLVPSSSHASTHKATVQVNCQAKPSTCGFPDATNSGVPASVKLQAVPGQVSSGPGWTYSATKHEVDVTGNGAVLTGLSIPYNLNITASNVTINNSKVVSSGTFAVSLRHTAGVTVENSTISGTNATSGRVNSAISDVYGDSTAMMIKNNDISDFRSAVQLNAGTVTGNYIHDPGYIKGDHTNGVISNGGTAQLTITHNTILNPLDQTDAITLDTDQTPGPVSNKTIENNLLAGGDYPIYGGTAFSHTTTNILIENNRFGQVFYRTSGQFGPVAYFSSTQSGNVWSGNVWDATGTAVPSP